MILGKIDLKLFLPALFLTTLGSFVLASVQPAAYPQQLFYLLLAFFAFWFAATVDIRVIRALSPYLYTLAIVLLLITFLFGAFSRGSVRWIDLKIFTLQTSEVAKPLLMLFFAWILARNTKPTRFFLVGIAMLPAIFLIFRQPDLGSALVVFAGFLGIVFIGGIPWKYLLIALSICVIISPMGWNFLADYQKERLFSHLNPGVDPLGSGYNSIQAMIAIGSGGIFGRGLGQGTQSQLSFLPERHTDFIFSAIGEELGFVGVGLVIIAFGFLLGRIIYLMGSVKDLYSKTYLGGIFAVLFSQMAINIGMNMGVLPITGIPLPFVSSGGSSLIALSFGLGIVSSISAGEGKDYV